ncbi:response regulator [Algibacter lectus]|uniref:Response regulator n=1 Tax=Algibacter lectus TaxID=221126 RepID=A0A090WK18_9FLAO|nr:response regulator [Algibacter lectus]GAL77346.1 response regulator [Algibacter lectus]
MKKDVIFCVDDEKIVLNSLKTELKNAFGNKYIIETAESGTEALEAIENLMSLGYKIQVVIADYAMPVMKGDEFLMNLHSKSSETLNILLTGQATIEGGL